MKLDDYLLYKLMVRRLKVLRLKIYYMWWWWGDRNLLFEVMVRMIIKGWWLGEFDCIRWWLGEFYYKEWWLGEMENIGLW